MTAREIERWERHIATKRWLHARPCTVTGEMDEPPCANEGNAPLDAAPLAAFADGPVADTAQPITAEAGRPVTQPDRDDLDSVSHA